MVKELTGGDSEPLTGTTLQLRRLWGSPRDWVFDSDDEELLHLLLRDLDQFRAEASSPTAVLFAAKDGHIIGTWTRGGAARLASAIVREPRPDGWLHVRNTLEDAVTGT